MDLSFLVPLIGFVIACCVNLALYFKFSSEKDKFFEKELKLLNEKEKLILEYNALCERVKTLEKEPVKTLTIEAQQILHDLTNSGSAVIRITPINPTDLFWRSPR